MARPKKCKHTIFDKNCDACIQLKNKWYAKLGDYNDAEREIGDIEKDEDHLKIWSADKFRPRHVNLQNGGWQAKAEYYQLAGRFLDEYKFATNITRVIWEYHAEGLTVPEIIDTLRKAKQYKHAKQSKIREVVEKHRAKMFEMYVLVPKKESYRE